MVSKKKRIESKQVEVRILDGEEMHVGHLMLNQDLSSYQDIAQAISQQLGMPVHILHESILLHADFSQPIYIEIEESLLSKLIEQEWKLESKKYDVANLRPWQKPNWFDRAKLWVANHLNIATFNDDFMEVIASTDFSFIAKVCYQNNSYYFKAGVSEPELLVAASWVGNQPDCATQYIAVDEQARWILTHCNGDTVAKKGSIDNWSELSQLLAQTHGLSKPEGLPTYPLAELAAQFNCMINDAQFIQYWQLDSDMIEQLNQVAKKVELSCERVLRLGLPEVLCHGDPQLNNFSIDATKLALFDWQYACIAHPFIDLGWMTFWMLLQKDRSYFNFDYSEQDICRVYLAYLDACAITEQQVRVGDIIYVALAQRIICFNDHCFEFASTRENHIWLGMSFHLRWILGCVVNFDELKWGE